MATSKYVALLMIFLFSSSFIGECKSNFHLYFVFLYLHYYYYKYLFDYAGGELMNKSSGKMLKTDERGDHLIHFCIPYLCTKENPNIEVCWCCVDASYRTDGDCVSSKKLCQEICT